MSLSGAVEDHRIVIRGPLSDVSVSVCAYGSSSGAGSGFQGQKHNEVQILGEAPEGSRMLRLKSVNRRVQALRGNFGRKEPARRCVSFYFLKFGLFFTHPCFLSLPHQLSGLPSCMSRFCRYRVSRQSFEERRIRSLHMRNVYRFVFQFSDLLRFITFSCRLPSCKENPSNESLGCQYAGSDALVRGLSSSLLNLSRFAFGFTAAELRKINLATTQLRDLPVERQICSQIIRPSP